MEGEQAGEQNVPQEYLSRVFRDESERALKSFPEERPARQRVPAPQPASALDCGAARTTFRWRK